MKIFIFLFVLLLAAPLFAYDDPDTPPMDSKIKASIADCRNFAVNFKSQSENDDKNAFQNRFGYPRDVNYSPDINDGSRTDYNYDAFTIVTLYCADDSCRVRCSPKF